MSSLNSSREGHYHNVHVASRGAAGNMASKRSGNLVGLNRAHHINCDAVVREHICRDPAVTAIIAKTHKNEDVFWLGSGNDRSGELTCKLHERCFSRAFSLDAIFETRDLLTAQNRSHLNLHGRSTFRQIPMLARCPEHARAHPR